MDFKWILFDLDNTLIDFSDASKESMKITCEEKGLLFTEQHYQIYQQYNHQVWAEFENQLIDAIELRHKRFDLFLQAINETQVDPLAFNQRYLENLVHTSFIYDGVVDMLSAAQKKYQLSIITNGLKEAQRPRLAQLQLTHFFDSIVVSDEIGVAKPAVAYFEYVYQTIPNPPPLNEILVVGDSINSDIKGGNNFGCKTCWYNPKKRPNETNVKADFELHSIAELRALLKS